MKKRSSEFEHPRSLALHSCQPSHDQYFALISIPTFALLIPTVYAGARYQYIMDNCEAAFTACPLTVPGHQSSIVKTGSLVEQDASAVD